ncbi:MAG TPA: hypothetical protein PKC43_03480 [Phycisphaerales bacterium]|nr:hypothetical protein [Phycisphaerales bacterium]HMP36491.1 hypothetical protein [Phycisphaerales bacterium]
MTTTPSAGGSGAFALGALTRPALLAAALGIGVAPIPALPAGAETVISFTLPSPIIDQWSYPFAANPGAAQAASIFAAWIDKVYAPQWDNRDGQMLVAFNTSAHVPAGLDPSAYALLSLRLSLTVGIADGWAYDPTQDAFETWALDREGQPGVDGDPGRPVEHFATSFRSGYTAASFTEATPYGPISFGKGIRYAFPVMFIDGAPVDVSNNIDEGFEVEPAAVGTIDDLEQGALVPLHSIMHFDVDLDQPALHAWLAQGLAEGRIFLSVASLFHTTVGASEGYARFLTKESPEVVLGLVPAPALALTVRLCEGGRMSDLDGDGVVDGADLGLLLAAWGPCAGPGLRPCPCAGDLNGDGVVDGADLGVLLAAWQG